MADWTQSGRVVGPRTSAKWKVKRLPGAPSALPPTTRYQANLAAKQTRVLAAHERGEPCGRGDCHIAICQKAHLAAKQERAALMALLRQDRHAKGESCGQRGCELDVCRAAAKASKAKSQRGAPTTKPSKDAATAARRRELHAKMLDCGMPGCKNPECVRLRAAKKAKRKAGPSAAGGSTLPVKSKPKVKSKSTATSSPARASSPVSAPTPDAHSTKKTVKPAPMASSKKSSTAMVCRECLRSKPIAAFPNPKMRRCEDCGGRRASRSVRTVQGGAPGLGKRR